jgi:hypothetical protein
MALERRIGSVTGVLEFHSVALDKQSITGKNKGRKRSVF